MDAALLLMNYWWVSSHSDSSLPARLSCCPHRKIHNHNFSQPLICLWRVREAAGIIVPSATVLPFRAPKLGGRRLARREPGAGEAVALCLVPKNWLTHEGQLLVFDNTQEVSFTASTEVFGLALDIVLTWFLMGTVGQEGATQTTNDSKNSKLSSGPDTALASSQRWWQRQFSHTSSEEPMGLYWTLHFSQKLLKEVFPQANQGSQERRRPGNWDIPKREVTESL
ncbi:uncharacterized protein LOC124962130 [Sciurus carolinensis]|uniref:uncharacterized protein LOC124962130 n=1 Tax=Sciurus carolinensis TaxID=30640 RepID=UPI001FB530D7|nr:uncharacterized protein LOC124962130 [Sciurus carolinensis]